MRHLTILPLYILTFCLYWVFFYRCQCVVKLLEALPTVGEEMRDKTSRCAFYLSLLFKLARQKSITRKCESRWLSVITVFCIYGEPRLIVKFFLHSQLGRRKAVLGSFRATCSEPLLWRLSIMAGMLVMHVCLQRQLLLANNQQIVDITITVFTGIPQSHFL